MTTLTGSTILTALAGDAAYVEIVSNAVASLPAIASVPVAMPDGTTSLIYQTPSGGSCRVGRAHYPNMATLEVADGIQAIFQVTHADHWVWRGVHFRGVNPSQYMLWLVGPNASTSGGSTHYGEQPDRLDHILFNQCAFETDENADGHGGSIWAWFEGDWLGVVNSYLDKWYGGGGSENRLYNTYGDCWGPLHIENNEFPLMNTQCFFTGGNNSVAVGVQMQDNVYRRNWQLTPASWRLDQVNFNNNGGNGPYGGFNGMQVQFANADPTTVVYLGGRTGGFISLGPTFGVGSGCTMYEPATGKARVCPNTPSVGTTPAPTTALSAPWPSPAFNTSLTVYFQLPFPNLLVNTGTLGSDFAGFTDVPVAHVANGSTAVTFTLNGVGWPLPTTVQVGHYFHLNNLHWDGGGYSQDTVHFPDAAHRQLTDTSYGFSLGITRAQCRRQMITFIAADRKSCTLENGYTVLAGEPTAFPFSVVLNDGLFRLGQAAGKGSWEVKCGFSRSLMEGNIFEGVPGTGSAHTVVNVGGFVPNLTFTVQSGIAVLSGPDTGQTPAGGNYGILRKTFNPRGWPYNGAETVWPYPVIVVDDSVAVTSGVAWGQGRVAWDVIDSTHIRLEPVRGLDPNRTFGDTLTTPQPYDVVGSWSPWWTSIGFTYRHNLVVGVAGGLSLLMGFNEGSGEITKGRFLNVHDNTFLLYGDPSVNFGPPVVLCSVFFTGAGPAGYGTYTTDNGQTSQDSSFVRYAKNTILRAQVSRTLWNIGISQATVLAHDNDVSDNILVYGAAPVSIFGSGSGSQATMPFYWDVPNNRVRRNVFASPTAAASLADPLMAGTFPDNAAPSGPANVGFVSYTGDDRQLAWQIVAGQTDPTALSGYALTDIFTTGTVSISVDGFTVTLDAGTFPATVQAGQFFKTNATGTLTPIRLINAPSLGANWATDPDFNVFTKSGGVAFSAGGSGPRTFQTATQALPPTSQWVQVTCPALGTPITTGSGPALFWTPAARTGYILQGSAGGTVALFRSDGANNYAFLVASSLTMNPGDTVLFEGQSGVLTATVNGVPFLSHSDATYGSGFAGLDTTTPVTHFASFSCGGYTSPGVRAAALFTDNFVGGGTTSFVLNAAYPAANVTGQPFTITFKGSATDGGDPGANIPLAQRLISNVRTRAIP